MQTALAFHNAVDQCFDRRAVVDVQVGTRLPGYAASAWLMRSAPSSVVAVPATW